LEVAHFSTPIGTLELLGNQEGIVSVSFIDYAPTTTPLFSSVPDSLKPCAEQLAEYFAGERYRFDLKLNLRGTVFQRMVWKQLLRIPFGERTTYQRIAYKLGNSLAVRAVGHANGRNPLGIIIPCHRVIGSGGDLIGYAYGIERKQWLLEFEKKQLQYDMF
jgi:methylated-DNA-[protein]-cysteine S-methyltransferase